jgi:hypothetical protein
MKIYYIHDKREHGERERERERNVIINNIRII